MYGTADSNRAEGSFFYAGKTHNRRFRGFFEGGQDFFDTEIILSRRTSRNRRLCVLPAYKKQHHKLSEPAILVIFMYYCDKMPCPTKIFIVFIVFTKLEMHSRRLYLSVLRICAPQPWLIFRSSGFRLVAFTLTNPKKVNFKKNMLEKNLY